MKPRPLNTRQKKFLDNHFIKGMSIAESVRRAGYSIRSGRSEDYSSLGCRILKTPRVSSEAQKIREKSFEKDALTFAEKRAFLARAVRADASSPDADLVQEIREEVDSEGRIKRVRKMVGKLEALSLDNKMIGDNFADRTPQASNPFLLIVSLGKTQGVSEIQVAGNPARLADASRAEPIEIDAELVN
jgi:hypothetical protein